MKRLLNKQRGQYYREEANREALKGYYLSEAEYLKNLGMVVDVLPFNAYTLPRVLQLIQRSNQFNLRTVRYGKEEINTMLEDKTIYPIAFSLRDKYGNYDIVSLIILKEESTDTWFIDSWIMSCRVLKRGLEHFVLNYIIALAKARNYKKIIGEYIPTVKNTLVEAHYHNLHFEQKGDRWVLDCDHYRNKKCFIQQGQKEHV